MQGCIKEGAKGAFAPGGSFLGAVNFMYFFKILKNY